MLLHLATQIPKLASANITDNEIGHLQRSNISFSIGGLYYHSDEADKACTYSLFPDCYPCVPLLCLDLVSHSNRPIVQEVVQIPNQEEFQTQRDRTEGNKQTAIERMRKTEEIAPSSHHDLIIKLI